MRTILLGVDMKKSSGRKENKQQIEKSPFQQRFNIEIGDDESKRRFIIRVQNQISDVFVITLGLSNKYYLPGIYRTIANTLGQGFSYSYELKHYISNDFYSCLQVLELLYSRLNGKDKQELSAIIKEILSQSETDLSVQWKEGIFIPAGAKLLDDKLINENLKWISNLGYTDIMEPFEKSLRHFLESNKYPDKLADTITDGYEAIEATAKNICANDKDLSANKELLVAKLKLASYYKKMLGDYIEYANQYRHAAKPGEKRKNPNRNEVEAFLYTTGLFIRLSIQQIRLLSKDQT
jgi:hypothetical protein